MILRHRYHMLFEFSELDWLFHDSEDIDAFLKRIIDLIYKHMNITGCSIYLWDESSEQLIFMASEKTVDQAPFRNGEFTGLNIRKGQGVCGRAIDSGSIEYGSKRRLVMAAPIQRGSIPVGVLNLERAKRPFSIIDEGVIRVLTSQLANILENAKLFYSGNRNSYLEPGQHSLEFSSQIILQGIAGAPGTAFGDSYTLDRQRSFTELRRIKYDKVYTLGELEKAIEKTEEQLLELQKNVEENLSDSASLIFTSHLLILKDNSFRTEIKTRINNGNNAPAALLAVTENYIKAFSESENPFVKEKVEDLEDLVQRIFSNMIGDSSAPVNVEGRVVISKSLYPSDMLMLASEKAAGILLVTGGITAHIAILAQSLKMPLVIIDFPDLIKTDKPLPILIDGQTGKLCINPGKRIIMEFQSIQADRQANPEEMMLPDLITSRDGTRVNLFTNINLIPDLEEAMRMNAGGVGLYRTEFPFLLRSSFPTEEEQYAVYKQVIELAPDKPITFRTLDVGGDKILSYYKDYTEENPFLGLRSIRFCLKNPAVFRQQLRAILRAAGKRKIKLMFPMISTMEELRSARVLVQECHEDLQMSGIPSIMPEIGAMIEIPSLLGILDHLCDEVDFLSIGSNDFVQYMLAVDRNNEKMSEYYVPHNPSVLRALNQIAEACIKHNVELTICGEMAHQKEYLPFLLGIGIRQFSVSTSFLNQTQRIISETSITEAEIIADAALEHSSIYEIERILGIS
ncbi:MAG: phosphoenolpyruvate--protein phosphotransferase [Spirochaetales bacterium]|nr:phosphoenolpyruvate--protein phosphotransferase [Spirochaetales bacterium]